MKKSHYQAKVIDTMDGNVAMPKSFAEQMYNVLNGHMAQSKDHWKIVSSERIDYMLEETDTASIESFEKLRTDLNLFVDEQRVFLELKELFKNDNEL